MLTVGRRRTKNLTVPAGVRPRGGAWYWQPTSAKERAARKARGEPVEITLGPADSKEARAKWADVSGYRDLQEQAGTVGEVFARFEQEGLAKKPNGRPRSVKTQRGYKDGLKVLGARFGACRYGKTAAEAMQGKAIGTVDFQQFIAEDGRPVANRHVSAASAAFAWAITRGLTAYNPCLGVVKAAEEPREREPQEWEVEALRAMAYATGDLALALMIDLEEIVGWRVSDIRMLARQQVMPTEIRHRHGKRGKKQRWERTPEVNRILGEAAKLPGAKDSMLIFPMKSGKMMSLDRFEKRWTKLKLRTNAALAACEVPLVIEPLHFQDLRSKAHDDAEDADMEGHEFLGNREEVADRHYNRRGKKVRPIR